MGLSIPGWPRPRLTTRARPGSVRFPAAAGLELAGLDVAGPGVDVLEPLEQAAGDLCPDQANERIIEVTRGKKIVWQYGMTGVSGKGSDQLNNPNSAELLANGNILIADENNNRAIEVTHNGAKKIVATFTVGGTASGMAFASRLPNGNTLLTDSTGSSKSSRPDRRAGSSNG